MRKSWFKKSLVVGIICLFVGTSVVPSISRDIGKLSSGSYKKDIGKIEPRQAFFDNPTQEEWIEVPLKVNVLDGVYITADTIATVVTDANEKLERADTNVRFVFDKDKDINWNCSDTGNDDGYVTQNETWDHPHPPYTHYWGLHSLGIFCLEQHFNSMLGFKVYFANGIYDSDIAGMCPNTDNPPNAAIKGRPIPVAYVKNRPNNITCTRGMGGTLAHEFVHATTMSADHSVFPSNLMYEPLSGRTGATLTGDQIKEIRAGASVIGETRTNGSEVRGSIVRVDAKRLRWLDDTGDVSEKYIDLFTGFLFAEGPTADLEVTIGLRGLYPNGTDVNSTFQMGFNTDNNNSTGYYGVDKILRITLQGKYPFTQPNGSISADLYDVDSGESVPLTPGDVIRIQEIGCVIEPPLSQPCDYIDLIKQLLPLPLLGPLADEVPIDLWAINLSTGEYDFASFQFDFNPPPGATIEMEPLEAVPGQNVNVNGTCFPPVSTVTLLIDDAEILQTTTLDDGTFSVSFTVPNLAPGWYFVTAMSDARGNQIINSPYFDFSILTVPSAPLEIDITGGLGVDAVITNNGTANASGIEWQLHVEGGILGLINTNVNGTIDIPMGEARTVSTGLFLGLGPITIIARANDKEKTATGTQFIIFSMVK